MLQRKDGKPLLAPSILSADFSRLGEEIREVEQAGCDVIHVDVMDGHFVPNLTLGAPIIKSLRKITRLPFDVHLMIDDPIRYVDDFQKAGSDWLTVHVEASDSNDEVLEELGRRNIKRGMSLKPGTPVEKLEPFLSRLDLILVMTVEPGFGGQSFMPEMMQKVKWLKSRFKGLVSVDGGINKETAVVVRDAGADIMVAGTAVFGQKDRRAAIETLRG